MPRATRAHYTQTSDNAAATLASAINPDNTAYTLPVSGTVTSGPTSGSTPVAIASGTGNSLAAVAAQAGLRLIGWSARSNAALGNTAKTVIRHGVLAGDTAIGFINLQDDQSEQMYYGPEGIACDNGISVTRDGTNAVEITLFY